MVAALERRRTRSRLALAVVGVLPKLGYMVNWLTSLLTRTKQLVASLFTEEPWKSPRRGVYGFLHFCIFVGRCFVKNRCPVRATALAYTTLLALVPLLAVSLGVSTSLLKSDRAQTQQFIDELISQVAPQLDQIPGSREEKTASRQQVIEYIQEFISNIDSGALGVSGTVALVFVAIGLLSTIEASFNDIWGVLRGRGWVSRVIHYWTAITLGPVIVVLVTGLAVSTQFLSEPEESQVEKQQVEPRRDRNAASLEKVEQHKEGLLKQMRTSAVGTLRKMMRGPMGRVILKLMPFVVLSLFFGFMYRLMPHAKVTWRAALLGGMVGALLWVLNSKFSVIFASRVVSASKIYGSLGIFPVLLIGIYVSWLIVLFGAQVSYSFQHRHACAREEQNQEVSQRRREFLALELMVSVAERFYRGLTPAATSELAEQLGVSPRLVTQLVESLCRKNLVVEVKYPRGSLCPLPTVGAHQSR